MYIYIIIYIYIHIHNIKYLMVPIPWAVSCEAWIGSTVDHPLQGFHVSCEDHLMDGLRYIGRFWQQKNTSTTWNLGKWHRNTNLNAQCGKTGQFLHSFGSVGSNNSGFIEWIYSCIMWKGMVGDKISPHLHVCTYMDTWSTYHAQVPLLDLDKGGTCDSPK